MKPFRLIFVLGLMALLLVLSWPDNSDVGDPDARTAKTLAKEGEKGRADEKADAASGKEAAAGDSTGPEVEDVEVETPSVDDRPDVEGDQWVTGIVKTNEGRPVEGAAVFFQRLPSDMGVDLGPLAGMASGMADGYKHGEVEGKRGDLFGNSMTVISDAAGRFRIRWPRENPRIKEVVDEAFSRIGGPGGDTLDEMDDDETINKALDADMDWAKNSLLDGPRPLRAAHDDYLPGTESVSPGDEIVIVVTKCGGMIVTVVDGEDNPLEDALIQRKIEDFDFSGMIHERTDENGRLRYLMKPGAYQFKVTHEEHAPASFRVQIDKEIVEQTVRMGEALFYSGRVVDPEGLPIAGAEVSTTPDLERLQNGDMEAVLDFDHVSAETSDDGVFRLGPFPLEGVAGTVIQVSHPHFEKLNTALPEGHDFGDIKLVPLPGLVVRVVDVDGNPVGGAAVWSTRNYSHEELQDPEKAAEWGESFGRNLVGFGEGELTDEKGEIVIHGEGEHEISATHGDFAPQVVKPKVDMSAVRDGQVEIIELDKGHDLVLTIHDWEGKPVEGLRVSAKPEQKSTNMIEMMASGLVGNMLPTFNRGADLITDAAGRAVMRHVAPVIYKIEVSGDDLPKTIHRLTVTKTMKAHTIKLDPPAILHGKVDAKFAGKQLMIQSVGKTHMARIEKDGSWESPPLSPGAYRVRFVEADNPMQMGLEMFGGMTGGKDMIKIKAGQRLKVDVVPPPSGTLTVTVNDPEGKAWSGMIMLVDPGMKQGDLDFAGRMHIGKKKEDGVYFFKNIAAGDWQLQAGAGMGGTSADRLRLTMRDGEERTLTWNLRAADGSVSGRLVDKEGKPIKGLAQLFRDGDSLPVTHANVPADGKFVFRKLIPGTYKMRLGDGLSAGRVIATLEVDGAGVEAGDITVADGVTLKGRVKAIQGDLPFGISVRLMRGGDQVGVGMPNLDGTFTFGNLEGAPALLEVVDGSGKVIGSAAWDGESDSIEVSVEGDDW